MPQNRILLGVIGRPHGVRGLVRVVSHTADPANLTAYSPLTDDRGRRFTLRWRGEGLAEVAELRDGTPVMVTDRTAAERLVNTRLYVDRAQLPEPDAEEFYVADLIGMAAIDAAGKVLGAVATVHDYGAGVSLEIVRDGAPPLLVPFTRAATPEVDLANRRVTIVPPEEADWRNTDEANDANDVNDANETNEAPSPLEEAGAAKRTEGGEGCIGRDRVEGGVVPKSLAQAPLPPAPSHKGRGSIDPTTRAPCTSTTRAPCTSAPCTSATRAPRTSTDRASRSARA